MDEIPGASPAAHTLGMNLTIWAEDVTAALALGVVLWLAVTRGDSP